MRIAHVSPYDHRISGGVREHVTNLAAHQRALGHDVTVIAPMSRENGSGHLPREPGFEAVSRTVLALPGAQSLAHVSVSPAVFGRMRTLLRREAFDVVHVHEPLVPTVSLSALWHARTTTVGTIHGYRPHYAAYQRLRWPLRRMMDRLSARVAVSVDARDWVSRYFPGEYHVIPDGVDVTRFADPALEPIDWMRDGRPTVLFVGRLDKRKGLPVLLAAFRAVQAALPDARLVVVGHFGARDRARAEELASACGVRDVVFVGYVDADDLPRYYRSADVFCAPSTGYEALGIVLLEAMAAGTAVVTTDIPGYRTVVRDGAGVVVPPQEPQPLADALVEVLRDDRCRAGLVAAGRRRVEHYAWPTVTRRLLDLYAAAGG